MLGLSRQLFYTRKGFLPMDISNKIAYLQGLADGLDLAEGSKEGKVIVKLIDVLADMAEDIEDLYDEQEEMRELLEAIDEDLGDVEDFLDDDCDCDCEDDCDECDDEDCYCALHADGYMEVQCPECGETVCFFNDGFEDDDTVEILCPNCDSVVYTIDNYMLENDEDYDLDEEELEQ